MTTVYVSRAAQLAAQAIVERGARFGRPVERSIVLIANARPAEPATSRETEADAPTR